MELELTINADGTVAAIYDDALRGVLAELGDVVIRRASHVEPTADGQWTADMAPSGGPILGPFVTRAAALVAETDWLRTHALDGS